jgi:hypothetical protein
MDTKETLFVDGMRVAPCVRCGETRRVVIESYDSQDNAMWCATCEGDHITAVFSGVSVRDLVSKWNAAQEIQAGDE